MWRMSLCKYREVHTEIEQTKKWRTGILPDSLEPTSWTNNQSITELQYHPNLTNWSQSQIHSLLNNGRVNQCPQLHLTVWHIQIRVEPWCHLEWNFVQIRTGFMLSVLLLICDWALQNASVGLKFSASMPSSWPKRNSSFLMNWSH
jgi:hypothetical protein